MGRPSGSVSRSILASLESQSPDSSVDRNCAPGFWEISVRIWPAARVIFYPAGTSASDKAPAKTYRFQDGFSNFDWVSESGAGGEWPQFSGMDLVDLGGGNTSIRGGQCRVERHGSWPKSKRPRDWKGRARTINSYVRSPRAGADLSAKGWWEISVDRVPRPAPRWTRFGANVSAKLRGGGGGRHEDSSSPSRQIDAPGGGYRRRRNHVLLNQRARGSAVRGLLRPPKSRQN